MTRQRALRILVSLGVALLFWLSVKLSATYHTVVEVPVSYSNLPAGLRLRRPLPQRLSIEVDGRGAQLLAHSLGAADTLTVDLSPAVRTGRLPREQLALQVEGFFPSSVQVRSIRPDTLRLDAELKVLRRLAVAPQVTLVPAEGWWQRGGLSMVPDSVLVLAPEGAVRGLSAWPTVALTLEAEGANLAATVPLATGDDVAAEPASVRVTADFERFSGGALLLPLRVANAPSGAQVSLQPAQVRVHYQAPWQGFEQVEPDDFELVIDAAQLEAGGRYVAPVVTRQPGEVRRLRLEPPVVQVRVSRRY